MRRLLLSIGLTLLLAACQSASGTKTYFDVDAPREPIKPGQTRITIKNNDRDHWMRVPSSFGSPPDEMIFECRLLACPDQTRVIYRTISTPRNPDTQAILKLSDDIYKRLQEKGATGLSAPKIGSYKSYKTVSFVFSFEKNDKTIYAHRLWIFSGSLSISLEGASYDKAFGQKAVEHFLPMIEIEDGGSLH